MSLENINAEIKENIITVNSSNIVYDYSKQEHKKIKYVLNMKNNTSNTVTVRVILHTKK